MPNKAQQALQLQMRQLELKQLALQVKLKRRQEEQAKEVEKVLAAKQHQLERERQHAFLKARERRRGLDFSPGGTVPSPRAHGQRSPVESAEELVEDSDGSSPRRLEISVRDARAIEKEREKAAYKALMTEQTARREVAAKEEAAKREQAARRIQAFRRASQAQRQKARATSDRLHRPPREKGSQHDKVAPGTSRSISPQKRREEASPGSGRAASESLRLPRQAVPPRNRAQRGGSTSRSPTLQVRQEGAAAPAQRPTRPGFSPRGGPPRSQSPCTEGTRRARTPSSLSPSQSPHGRRHGRRRQPHGPSSHSPSPQSQQRLRSPSRLDGAASSSSPIFLLPNPPSPLDQHEGEKFRPPWLPPGSPEHQVRRDLDGKPTSPRQRSTGHRVRMAEEQASSGVLRSASPMEVTFAAPDRVPTRAASPTTWRSKHPGVACHRDQFVQNPIPFRSQGHVLPSAEEAERMLSPLMGACHPEPPAREAEEGPARPSPRSPRSPDRSGGTGMAWWVDFEGSGPPPKDRVAQEQPGVGRTSPAPASSRSLRGQPPCEPVERRIAEMARIGEEGKGALGRAYIETEALRGGKLNPVGWSEVPSVGENFAHRLGMLQQEDVTPPVPSRNPSELWELRVQRTNSQLEKLREVERRRKETSPGSRAFTFGPSARRQADSPRRSHSPKRTPAFGTSDPVIPSRKIIQKYSDYFVSSPSNKKMNSDTEASREASPPRAAGADASPKLHSKSPVVYPRSREVHGWQAAGFEAASVYKGLRNAAGLREGWGVLNQKDGSTYAGQWVSGKRHGVGTLVFDGGIFEGQWARGEASGSGLVRFTNGDKFEGQYAGNRKHGFGTYCWADGAAEEGQYFNGRKVEWHTWSQGPSQWKLRYDNGAVVEAQQVTGKERPSRSVGAYPRAKEPRLSPFGNSERSPKPKTPTPRPRKAPQAQQQDEDRSGSPAQSLIADLQPQEPGRPALSQARAPFAGTEGRQQAVVGTSTASSASAGKSPEALQRMALAISKVNSLYRQVALPAEAHESF
ncbi:Morn1 [Symbiodinium natans]|uniref:Morn1 protein n=1 Tax=Symbiodinium natans TaxID=878477 RepID=A0A812RXP9_9DINO|nr:Morn1 [Symbiodinium natans]